MKQEQLTVLHIYRHSIVVLDGFGRPTLRPLPRFVCKELSRFL